MRDTAAARLMAAIRGGLERHADPARAEGARRYLKSDLAFLGVGTPDFRRVVRGALASAAPGRRVLLALVEMLWAEEVFELRAAAVESLTARVDLLVGGDMTLLERLIRESRTWALVDNLAASVAGPLVERDPQASARLDAWAADGDFWVRRAALLALLVPLRRGVGDFERFSRFADAMLAEREFFIRKAIGWVLRDTAKRRPALVAAWLEPRVARVSGLTLREAVKPLPAEVRARLLAARATRPAPARA